MQNNNKKLIILSVLFCALCVFAFIFTYKKINLNNQLAEQSLIDWQNETTRRDEIKLLNKSIKTIQSEKESLEMHFAKSTDVVPFLDTIEKLGTEVGAKAEVVSVNILEDKSGLLVRMKAIGTFDSVYRLLTLLENSPYELEFVSADINNPGASLSETSEGGTKWTANFELKLLSFIQ